MFDKIFDAIDDAIDNIESDTLKTMAKLGVAVATYEILDMDVTDTVIDLSKGISKAKKTLK